MSGRSTEVPGRVDATDESGDERGSAFALATTVAFGAALGSAGLNDPLHPVRETSLVPAVDDVLAGTRMVLLVVTGVDAEAVSRSARAVPDVLTSLSRSARADVSAGRVRSSRTARADASAGRGRSPPSRTARVDVVTNRDGSPLSRAPRGDVAARLDERPSTTPAESRELLPSTPLSEFPPKIDQNALALVPLKKMSTEDETPKLAQDHQQACPSRQPALGPKPTSTHP